MENQKPSEQKNYEEHRIDGFKIFLAILAIILVISNVITVYFLLNKNKQPENTNQNTNNNIVVNENNINDDINTDLPTEEILVDWYTQPIAINVEEFFGADKIALNKKENPDFTILEVSSIEKVGQVKTGAYAGDNLYAVLIQEMGTTKLHAIKHNDDVLIFNNQIDYNRCADNAYKYLCTDINTTIQNLETPETIEIANSNLQLIKKEWQYYQKFSELENIEKLFEYAPGKYIYQEKFPNSKNLNYLATAEDQSIRLYELKLDFLGTEGESSQYLGQIPNTLDITWSDGTKNSEEFLQETYRNSQSYAYYIKGLEDLKITGQTKTGKPIYELKNPNFKEISADTENIFEKMYNSIYTPAGQETPFAEFLKQHPIIFWQDPFGNFLEFRNAEFMPAAEFGKPVIYLYPEKTTDVSVKVSPNKGLTITEPAYNNGWLVKAYPDGNLYNYNDQKNYPYLFWEGRGINYQIPKDGFVVAKNDIRKFLVEKLSEQGLIAKEYNEFIDFWAPKMTEQAYYFITFMPQADFDKLAPLEISPRPDTIIRVFMDYRPLNEIIKVKTPVFKTPARNGFTVVEWGGALHN
ncbi:MAG: hypothetical protein WCV71_01410 [Patescibacteria group bacterium]